MPDDGADPNLTTDEEETLVHELLHLHTEPFAPKEDDAANDDHEFCLNAVAGALVELDRA